MIQLRNVSKSFDGKKLFHIDDVVFPSKGLVVIKGENGSGKTTLFNMLSLMDMDYDGEILFDGVDFKKEKECNRARLRRDKISYVFQKRNFVSFLSVEANQGIYSDKIEGHTSVKSLSQGQQEKAVLDSYLGTDKDFYYLDEVLSSLDQKNREVMIQRIISLSKSHLVVLVSHDVNVEEKADAVYLMKDGTLSLLKKKESMKEVSDSEHPERNYRINRKKVFLSYSLSKSFVMLLNAICLFVCFLLGYVGCMANANDCFFYLSKGLEKSDYVILDTNHMVTTQNLKDEFKDKCYLYSNDFPAIAYFPSQAKEDDNLYCNQQTYLKYEKMYFSNVKIKDYKYSTSKSTRNIIIDNSITEPFFLEYHRNIVEIDDFFLTEDLHYEIERTPEEEKNLEKPNNNNILLYSASYFVSLYPSYKDFEFKEDTFYVADKWFYSKKHVDSFRPPLYSHDMDSYKLDFNQVFPNGVDTVLLDMPMNSNMKQVIVVSDSSVIRVREDMDKYRSVLLLTDGNYLKNSFSIYSKKLNVHNPQTSHTGLKDESDRYFEAYNKNFYSSYTNSFTYSLLFYFFAFVILFTQFVMYSCLLNRHRHDFEVLRKCGLSKGWLFLLSLTPFLPCLLFSSVIGGILALMQASFSVTFFVTGIPYFLVLSLLLGIGCFLLFYRGMKKHE